MGYPMAGHLAQAGFSVCVYNRSYQKMQSWVIDYHGQSASNPKDASKQANIVITCVGNDADVEEVLFGEHGAIESLSENSIVIDHTTTSASFATSAYERLKAKNIHFIDAPVSGGQSGAQQGKLTVMCGGDEAPIKTATPIMEYYSQAITHIGATGSGQICKMVNQISAIGAIAGLAEGMAFAQKSGIDLNKVYQAIEKGAAGSWQMSNRYPTMIEDRFDFGFAIQLMQKDLRLCLEQAERINSEMPLTTMTTKMYQTLEQLGHGKLDTSALIKHYQQDDSSRS